MAVTPANKIVRGGDLQTVGTEIKSALAGKVGSSSVSTIVSLTQAQYNALTTKDANTAYIITDAQSGGTTEVFWATRGTTTYAEVLAAYNAGKLVCVNHNGSVFVLSSYNSTDSEFLFASCNAEYNIEFLYLDTNGWDPAGTTLAGTNSPAFTGTPTAPTAATGTNTTQIATTAFVQNTVNSSSNKEVLWVTYGTTTYDDIWDAINIDKKIVLCQYQDWIYYCIGENTQGQSLDFVCLSGYGYNPEIKYVSCDSNSGWYNDTSALQDISQKVTSLSSSSTHSQYPSAKAVYDMIGDVESLINAL